MADASKLQQGSIVWISAPDPRHKNPKKRPFVMVSDTSRLKSGDTLVGIAVTTSFREPVDEALIAMRWNSRGTTETGFRQKCFAKCDWAIAIPIVSTAEHGIAFAGDYQGKSVRLQELAKILEVVAKYRR